MTDQERAEIREAVLEALREFEEEKRKKLLESDPLHRMIAQRDPVTGAFLTDAPKKKAGGA